MVEIIFKDKKIQKKTLKWGEVMDILQERKKAIEANDEFAINLVAEKLLFGFSGLTRDDIKDWAPTEVYECLDKLKEASDLPLQPDKS